MTYVRPVYQSILDSGEQYCPNCETVKPLAEYSKARQGRPGNHCRQCDNAKRREAHDLTAALKQRSVLYNIPVERIMKMYVDQEGKCPISGTPLDFDFHLDHNSDTGVVRGLLCPKCNMMIGLAKHNVDRLMSAATYLMQEVDVLHYIETESK